MSDLIELDLRQDLKVASVEYWSEVSEFEAINIQRAMEKYFFSGRLKWPIQDLHFINQVHNEMFCDVWRWAGQYRIGASTIGVPFTEIGAEMLKATEDLKYWIKNEIFAPAEIAVRFHHRLVSIHPYVNGNGRHARVYANLIMAHFTLPLLPWGGDIEKNPYLRREYLLAISEADKKKFQTLINFALKQN